MRRRILTVVFILLMVISYGVVDASAPPPDEPLDLPSNYRNYDVYFTDAVWNAHTYTIMWSEGALAAVPNSFQHSLSCPCK